MTAATSYPKHKIRALLLEGVHSSAQELIRKEGLDLEAISGSLSEEALIEKMGDVHLLGIRSKTQVTDAVLAAGRRLLGVGCFCIGTNQVALSAANRRGVPVFNAPFSNTRSVAELVICEIIALSRRLCDLSQGVHRGQWNKSAKGCFEVRGKTLGIVGYGHIGRQVGVLAETMGLSVIYYDIATKLAMGNNKQRMTLDDMLRLSDFVTLHVPATEQTQWMMGEKELAQMKPGSCLLNLSRGTVVVIEALARALRDKHLAGAAIDVYPEEPQSNSDPFVSELQGLPNVILTPHVGGSTEEAQASIGVEVASTLLKFVNTGTTTGAVNFPQVEPAVLKGRHRILNTHKNVPGVLGNINRIVGEVHANVESQVLATDSEVGYLVMDLNQSVSDEVYDRVAALDTSIRTRILY